MGVLQKCLSLDGYITLQRRVWVGEGTTGRMNADQGRARQDLISESEVRTASHRRIVA
jgi:hypothetical protein